MHRCIHALIHVRKRDATVSGVIASALLFSTLFFGSSSAIAQNPVLREVEVRSFLGEPLNLRIALAASTERDSTAICQSVIDTGGRENALRSSDLVLTMVELRNSRYLQIRSRTPFNEPVARFSLRIGCPGEPLVDQDFTVLLDPPPFTALPVVPLPLPTASADNLTAPRAKPTKGIAERLARTKPVVPASGTWSVNEGDTLAKLAQGIHPKNRARRIQYIATLRELNPAIADVADNTPLTPGTQLALPDLLTLSGIMPRVAVDTASASTPAVGKSANVAEKPVAKPVPQAIPKPSAAPAASLPVPKAAPPRPTATATLPPAIKPSPVVVTESPAPAAKPAQGTAAPPRGESFRLRLSSSEMDLSRSRNVTDEQRRQLREKQLMLDADDQVAALLSLKNTVKQLEQRLNEMQLKLAAAPTMRPTEPASSPLPLPLPLPSAPSASSSPTSPTSPASRSVPPASSSPTAPSTPSSPSAAQKLPTLPVLSPPVPAVAPAPDAPPAVASASMAPNAPPVAAAAPPTPAIATGAIEKPVPSAPVIVDAVAHYLPSPLATGGIIVALLALLAAWVWSRRAGGSSHRINSVTPVAADFEATPEDAVTPDYASHQPAPPLPARTRPGSTHDARFADSGKHMADKLDEFDREAVATNTPSYTASEAAAAVHHPVDAPVIFDDTPDRFEVDSRPVTTVDFLVGMDEKLPEDRVRRLQYMHERYPELKSNTVSIDDADSVINAARMYYEEADKGNGRDKACELLTFAVEERPQEIRFWLAQFEIFRLENMPAEFTAMAGKFHVLFSHTSAWPMVRHIGHELDPGNPLFAAGGSPLLAGETRFDPIAENWLNAPMDFTSDALMSDLRLALLDDYGVSRADFESITARLSTEGTT